MAHQLKDFNNLIGPLHGFSEKQLTQHFTLYQGYVKKLNEIQEKLAKADRAAPNYSFNEYSELKRREAVAFNGAVLHELYFENMTKAGAPSAELQNAITVAFGSQEHLLADLRAAAGSTPGWVLLTLNMVDGALHSYIMFEHHIGLPVMNRVLLALDCWEHAFMIDYGINKAEYLNAFFANLNWDVVNTRFEKALKILKL